MEILIIDLPHDHRLPRPGSVMGRTEHPVTLLTMRRERTWAMSLIFGCEASLNSSLRDPEQEVTKSVVLASYT